MPELTCERCGTDFATDRDGVVRGQDTTRCPSCGKQHPLQDGGGGPADDAVSGADTAATATLDVGDDGHLVVEIHAHVHVHDRESGA